MGVRVGELLVMTGVTTALLFGAHNIYGNDKSLGKGIDFDGGVPTLRGFARECVDRWAAMTSQRVRLNTRDVEAEVSADRAAIRRTLSTVAENHLILASRQKAAEERIEQLEVLLSELRHQPNDTQAVSSDAL
jgi:hypothetical protein